MCKVDTRHRICLLQGGKPSGPPSLADEAFVENPLVPDSPHSSAALQHGRGPRLYVGGVHADIIEEDVKQHFSRWGRVLDVYFPGIVGTSLSSRSLRLDLFV